MHELDLHGVRLDAAEAATIQFVDQLYFQGVDVGRIVHGFGAIADHLPGWLRSYPYVKKVEREMANKGATLVWLDVR